MDGALKKHRTAVIPVLVLLFIAGGLPFLSMLYDSITTAGHFDLSRYAHLFSSRQWVLMARSILLSGTVAVLTVIAGVPLGILLSRTDLPFRKVFTAVFSIPLTLPPYITAVSWSNIAGRNGWLSIGSEWLFGFSGCVLVLFTAYLPLTILTVMVYSRSLNPSLEEAGRLVAGWRKVLLGITLPSMKNGIILSASLVFLLSIGELAVPMYLRYDVFPVESFTQFTAFYDFKSATALMVPMLLTAVLVIFLERKILQKGVRQIKPALPEKLPVVNLGKWKWVIFSAVALMSVVLVVIPMSSLIAGAGWHSYAEAIRRAGDSVIRSIIYAATGATVLTVLGIIIGYSAKSDEKLWKRIDFASVLFFAVPGTVLGIGLISLWNNPTTNFIYSSFLVILLGYIAKYTVLTERIMAAVISGIPDSMEESAETVGVGWLKRMLGIIIPLSTKGIALSWIIGYIFSARDMGMTMLVYPSGSDTLPVRTFTLMANGNPDVISALCVITILVILLPPAIIGKMVLWRKR